MTDATRIDATELVAFDVHVHLEHTGDATGGRRRRGEVLRRQRRGARPRALAEYYRSRKMACVVFTVDERLTGRPQVPNDVVREFAAANADVAIAFASIDPTRGPEAVREARRLVDAGVRPRAEAASAAAAVLPERSRSPIRCTRCSPRRGCPCSFTPATAASAPACRAAAASG